MLDSVDCLTDCISCLLDSVDCLTDWLSCLLEWNQLDVEYYVTRLEGRHDVTSSCHITGFVVYLVNALDSTESSFRHKTHDIRLGVRDQYKIETKYFTKDGIRILKVYFDVE